MKLTLAATAMAVTLAVPGIAAAVDDQPPTAPGNPTIRFYNGAGGELLWNAATDDARVLGYQVTRNGVDLGVLDALSVYDPSMVASTPYTFTITAIDSAGQRSPTVTVSQGGNASLTVPTGADVPPPATARAVVYSRSTLELFWDRSNDTSVRYEVRRNGAVVDSNSGGTSYYDSTTRPDTDYTYEVIALSGSQRSRPSVMTLRTDAPGTFAGTTGNAPAPDSELASSLAPLGLELAVYSSTVAELLWTPGDQDAEPILSNEIRRNGELIATLPGSGLRSFMDRERMRGVAYEYEVTAVSASGRGASSVGADDGAAPPVPAPVMSGVLPVVTETQLAANFQLLNGGDLAKVAAIVERLRNPNIVSVLDRDKATFTDIGDGSVEEVWACPGGGVLQYVYTTVPAPPGSGFGSSSSYVHPFFASDCVIGEVVVTGGFEVDSGDAGELYLSGFGTTVDDLSDLSSIDLEEWSVTNNRRDPDAAVFFAEGLSVERIEGSYSADRVFGLRADSSNPLPDGTLGTTFFAEGVDGALGVDATVRTTGPFEFGNGRGTGKPSRGRLTISSGANSWKLDAANGDPITFGFTSEVDGVVTGYTVPWSDSLLFREFQPHNLAVGF